MKFVKDKDGACPALSATGVKWRSLGKLVRRSSAILPLAGVGETTCRSWRLEARIDEGEACNQVLGVRQNPSTATCKILVLGVEGEIRQNPSAAMCKTPMPQRPTP